MADDATGEGMTNERRAQKWGRGPPEIAQDPAMQRRKALEYGRR